VNPNDYKQCSYCKEEFPKTEFYKNKNTKDGFDSYCKPCRNSSQRTSEHRLGKHHGRNLRMNDFYHPEKKWKKLETWNKFDIHRFDELLYNGGDVTEVFFNRVEDRIEWEKSKKKKRRWGK